MPEPADCPWGIAVARAKRKKTNKRTENTRQATKGKADYVIQCIRDQPWLDGRWTRLVTLVCDRFACCTSTAGNAVSLAYELLEQERQKNIPQAAGYVDRMIRRVIEGAMRDEDWRAATPAIAEFRKIYGVGEAEKVSVSGSVTHEISQDDKLLLEALRLTNAQRLAEIEKLEKELGVPHWDPTQKTPQSQTVLDNNQEDTEIQEDGQETASSGSTGAYGSDDGDGDDE